MDDQAAYYAATYVHEDATVRHTLALQALTAEEQELARLTRYETALQRAHDRAVRNLKNVREMRAGGVAPEAAPEPAKQEITKRTPEPAATPKPEPPPAPTPPPSVAQTPAAPAPIAPIMHSREAYLQENMGDPIWRPSCHIDGVSVEPSSCPDAK
jgi:outer membrane biosynthesis protein TonB